VVVVVILIVVVLVIVFVIVVVVVEVDTDDRQRESYLTFVDWDLSDHNESVANLNYKSNRSDNINLIILQMKRERVCVYVRMKLTL
jgi:hypothetical protein